MVALSSMFGRNKKAYDYQAATDAFIAHFDRLFAQGIEHATETQTIDALVALANAMQSITEKANEKSELLKAMFPESD